MFQWTPRGNVTRIVWLPSMSVGIEKWDSDHKVLLELINRLDEALRNSGGPETVRRAIDTLVAYAEVHFRIEEHLMQTLRYPRYASHRAEHDTMRAWIAERREWAESGDSAAVLADMAEHLVHWLYTHVLTIDMQYTEFFDEQRRKVGALLDDYDGLTLEPPFLSG